MGAGGGDSSSHNGVYLPRFSSFSPEKFKMHLKSGADDHTTFNNSNYDLNNRDFTMTTNKERAMFGSGTKKKLRKRVTF